MIINSDERQWTWLEGLNTFVQTVAEELWDKISAWEGIHYCRL
jgi:hypothetical protein